MVAAMRSKLAGNEQLRNGKILDARNFYVEGLHHVLQGVEALRLAVSTGDKSPRSIVELDSFKSELEEVRVQLISNLSLTEIKLEMWSDALAHSSMVLVADPGNAKALFRRSVARIRLNEQLDSALFDLQTLLSQDQQNSDIRAEIAICKQSIKWKKPTDFEKNIKKSMKQPQPSFFESIQTILVSLGKTFSQCGGNRARA